MHGADTPNAGFTSQTVSLNRNSDPLAPLPRLTTPARPEIALLRGNHVYYHFCQFGRVVAHRVIAIDDVRGYHLDV